MAVAKMIQATSSEVTIHYNQLHADPAQGESLDIALKKLKHRLVEGMSTNTADSLGLSRAILCNDSLVMRLQDLQGTESMYRGLVEHCKRCESTASLVFQSESMFLFFFHRMLKAHFDVIQCFSMFGRNFAEIKEPQQTASETFRIFSEMHRNMEKDGLKMLKAVKPVLSDLGTYLTKAIPDTKLTIRRYADAKFTYLSYCLKVKELDDEEHTYAALQDPLYRVETGNYEYRMILRCRQEARAKFASLRNDVLEKLELLESKHAQDLANQLRKLIEGLAVYSEDISDRVHCNQNLFPIEVDLKPGAFQYKSNEPAQYECDDDDLPSADDIPIEMGQEALTTAKSVSDSKSTSKPSDSLIPGFDNINLDDSKNSDATATNNLLVELGIADIDLSLGANHKINQNADPNSLENCIDWLTSSIGPSSTTPNDNESNQPAEINLLD